MVRKEFFTCILIVIILSVTTPTKPNETIFHGLTGKELLDSLVANYKTSTVLSYDNARDTLFANIYKHDDSLTCVYTGYTIYLDPAQDPSTCAYNQGINTEHTWPQSKGAVGQAKCDMHHLYPVRSVVNSSRSNDPFYEISDTATDKWYRLDTVLTTIPTEFIDEYSEKENDSPKVFEPREDHKGNVARAMYYFYTMYKHEADSCGPGYFPLQKDILYQWHVAEPVDSLEDIRNGLIANYQGGKKNPFILDSTLVRRAYFFGSHTINSKFELPSQELKLEQNYPNPFYSSTIICYSLSIPSHTVLKIYDTSGRVVKTLVNKQQRQGHYMKKWRGKDDFNRALPSGIYFYRLTTHNLTATKEIILIN